MLLYFACLSVSAHITRKLHSQTLYQFLCMLPVDEAHSSSDGVTICHILPVLWMTSCFHTMGQNQAQRQFAKWHYQLDVRQLQC